ncbi:MAG: amidohydrolase family protein [Bryobacteraceae bacterium]
MRGPREARRGPSLNEPGLILDGSVLIRDGRVQEVGPTRRVENLKAARDAVEISAAGRVVMPGFVDGHTHLAFPPPGWAQTDAASALNAVKTSTARSAAIQARNYLQAMARHGTTTVEAKAGCGGGQSAEVKLLRALSLVKRDPLDVVATFLFRLPSSSEGQDAAEAAVEWVCGEFLPLLHRRRLAQFADIEWSQGESRQRLIRRYLETAARLGLGCRLHAGGDGSLEALALARELRISGIDHLEEIAIEELGGMAASAPVITLLPGLAFHKGSRPAPARALIEAGAAVAVGSNFNRSGSPMLNMQTVVSLACREMGMTPAEALVAATINGAYALGCPAAAGSLEPGKPADLVVFNVSDYQELGYHSGMNLVHLTMKRGEFIYQEGDVAPLAAENLRLAW